MNWVRRRIFGGKKQITLAILVFLAAMSGFLTVDCIQDRTRDNELKLILNEYRNSRILSDTISPDGKWLVDLNSQSTTGIWSTIRRINQSLSIVSLREKYHSIEIPLGDIPGMDVSFEAWSPDSRSIAFFGDIEIVPKSRLVDKIIIFSVGEDEKIGRKIFYLGEGEFGNPVIAWSPDSSRLAVYALDDLFLFDADANLIARYPMQRLAFSPMIWSENGLFLVRRLYNAGNKSENYQFVRLFFTGNVLSEQVILESKKPLWLAAVNPFRDEALLVKPGKDSYAPSSLILVNNANSEIEEDTLLAGGFDNWRVLSSPVPFYGFFARSNNPHEWLYYIYDWRNHRVICHENVVWNYGWQRAADGLIVRKRSAADEFVEIIHP